MKDTPLNTHGTLVWGPKNIPVKWPSFVPANERRAAAPKWRIKVTRKGRVLTLRMMAPSVEVAQASLRELEAAAWAYTRSRGYAVDVD